MVGERARHMVGERVRHHGQLAPPVCHWTELLVLVLVLARGVVRHLHALPLRFVARRKEGGCMLPLPWCEKMIHREGWATRTKAF
jgi:hypothetical protein